MTTPFLQLLAKAFGSPDRPDDKIAAIEHAAAETGKSRREVFDAAAASWRLDVGERARILGHLASTPEPPTPAEIAARRAAAESAQRQAAEHDQTARVARIDRRAAVRDLERRSPFAAARERLRDPHTHYSDDDDPPPTAA